MKQINHIEALSMLKSGKSLSDYKVEVSEHQIEALDALLLGEHNILIPKHLIYYNDDEIDFSDDPDISEEDFMTGRLVKTRKVHLKVREDINEWLTKSNINVDRLATKLIEDFYDNLKVVNNK